MNKTRQKYGWVINVHDQTLWLLKRLTFNILAWNILVRIFLSLTYLLNPELGISGAKIFQLFSQNKLLLTTLVSTIAVSSWLLEDVLFFSFLNKKSMGELFLLRIVFFSLMLLFIFLLISVFHYKSVTSSEEEYLHLIRLFFFNRASIYLFLTGIFSSVIINFFKALRQKIGFEKFWPFILGRYRIPKEENRIFVFIDLISSTNCAEQLGHKKYSYFIQECFKYLGALEIKYNAMQYQFVGDEVVLSWPAKEKNYLKAVQFYFEYLYILKNKQSLFLKNFGIIPQFSASINSGNVMVSEVGTVKSEIAFHGDVLNTAAGIQKHCRNYNKPLLVTQDFAIEFKKANPEKKVLWIGEKNLSGKQYPVNIYSIEL